MSIKEEVKLLMRRSCTKKEYSKLLAKQRTQVEFNTGTRVHKNKKSYSRKQKYKNNSIED